MSHLVRRAGAAALVVAALALGHVVTSAWPLEERTAAPFVRTGAVGAPVALRYADVTAGPATGSTVLQDAGTLLATPGIWLVVPLTVDAAGEPRRLGYAAVIGSDGRTYVASGLRSRLALGLATPGIAHHGAVVVELPADAAVGARLHVALEPWDQRADDLADIDLGIAADDVAAWSASSEALRVPLPSDAPGDER